MRWVTDLQPLAVIPGGVKEISAQLGGTTIQHKKSLSDKLKGKSCALSTGCVCAASPQDRSETYGGPCSSLSPDCTSAAQEDPFRGLWVHPDKFRSQMAWLKRLGYQGLSLQNAMPYIKGEKTGKVAVITFDDGFLNNYENALPVLAEFNFTATNYFVANQVGGSNIWDQAMGVPSTPCMSVTQMREWAALGHEVGAHTVDHVNLEKRQKKKLADRSYNPRPCLKTCLDRK